MEIFFILYDFVNIDATQVEYIDGLTNWGWDKMASSF